MKKNEPKLRPLSDAVDLIDDYHRRMASLFVGRSPQANLLITLGAQRDRAQALLPVLRSIDAGLYGSGKEALPKVIAAGKETPESAQQIMADLDGILEESGKLAGYILERL